MRSGGANYRGEDKFVHMMRAIGRIKEHLDGLERFHVRISIVESEEERIQSIGS